MGGARYTSTTAMPAASILYILIAGLALLAMLAIPSYILSLFL